MLIADNTVRHCYIACLPSQPCVCRDSRKYPKVSLDKDQEDQLKDM